MINRMIMEINKCLENGCYIAALTTALTLPDICGKAKYPDLGDRKSRERYIKWYDEYIGQYEKCPEDTRGMPYLSGELVYSLRCSLLHQGNPNIEEKLDIEYFELIWSEDGSFICGSSEAEIVLVDGVEKAIHKKYSVNIWDICHKLCWLAEYYYNKHKDKFAFFNYHIENIDYRTKELFGIE